MNKLAIISTLSLATAACILPMTGCETAPSTEQGRTEIVDRADTAVLRAKANDPSLVAPLASAVGYAVFPKVGKGGAGIGGAYGKGVLYQGGVMAGYCDLSQASIGLQLGGQTYTEIIVFATPEALNLFKSGNFAFDAQATAVALRSGSGANAKYTRGVAVFTMDEAGLMAEATIGGQKFSYLPKNL